MYGKLRYPILLRNLPSTRWSRDSSSGHVGADLHPATWWRPRRPKAPVGQNNNWHQYIVGLCKWPAIDIAIHWFRREFCYVLMKLCINALYDCDCGIFYCYTETVSWYLGGTFSKKSVKSHNKCSPMIYTVCINVYAFYLFIEVELNDFANENISRTLTYKYAYQYPSIRYLLNRVVASNASWKSLSTSTIHRYSGSHSII